MQNFNQSYCLHGHIFESKHNTLEGSARNIIGTLLYDIEHQRTNPGNLKRILSTKKLIVVILRGFFVWIGQQMQTKGNHLLVLFSDLDQDVFMISKQLLICCPVKQSLKLP